MCATLLAVDAGCFHLLLGGEEFEFVSSWRRSQLSWLLEGDLCLGRAISGRDGISNRLNSRSYNSNLEILFTSFLRVVTCILFLSLLP